MEHLEAPVFAKVLVVFASMISSPSLASVSPLSPPDSLPVPRCSSRGSSALNVQWSPASSSSLMRASFYDLREKGLAKRPLSPSHISELNP